MVVQTAPRGNKMEAILYAEVYFICIIVVGLLLYWAVRSDSNSTTELWLKRMLCSFTFNFISNFLFTLFNRIIIIDSLVAPLSYILKSAYFITLIWGVYCWGGYAESVVHSALYENKNTRLVLRSLMCAGFALVAVNLRTHWIFAIDSSNAYVRNFMFRALLGLLVVCSLPSSVNLLRQSGFESDPAQKGHMCLTASFPLCILCALLLSYAGERIPVICVSVMIELLCIYTGTVNHQISMDKLTQVNNRQNLIGFMNYKLKNHEGDLYLLMIDLDYFKTINDTYGHLEGDRALVELSTALKLACKSYPKRPYIARYGGDEFIIVMEGTREDVERLCESVRAQLNGGDRRRSYDITVSIGYARWTEGMDHKALIQAADEGLYAIKHNRR